jgi:hypothetical protein
MNSLQQRLAAITDTAANLKAQLLELEGLREQVEKAEQARSPPPKGSGQRTSTMTATPIELRSSAEKERSFGSFRCR